MKNFILIWAAIVGVTASLVSGANERRSLGSDDSFSAPSDSGSTQPGSPTPTLENSVPGFEDSHSGTLLDQLNQPGSEELNPGQLKALERFLDMPPEQLARIRSAIQSIEAMSEVEKEALRAQIREFRQLQQEKIQQIREAHRLWRSVNLPDRRLIQRYVASLPKEEAQQLRRAILTLDPEGRRHYLQSVLEQAIEAETAAELPARAEKRFPNLRDPGKDGIPPR